MSSRDAIQNTISKVVGEAYKEIEDEIGRALDQALEVLTSVERETRAEVSRILEMRDKQGEVLKRQIVGGAELSARNRSLQVVEEAVGRVFDAALEKLKGMDSDPSYVDR